MVPLGRLNDSVAMFGISFAPSKCAMLLQNWIISKPNLIAAKEVLGSCISTSGLILDDASFRIKKTRFAFTNSRYLWCRRHIRLSIKSSVQNSDKVGVAIRLRNMVVDSRRHAKTFDF